jgi:hypothetical protein
MGREADNFHLMLRLRMRGTVPPLACVSVTLCFYKEGYKFTKDEAIDLSLCGEY